MKMVVTWIQKLPQWKKHCHFKDSRYHYWTSPSCPSGTLSSPKRIQLTAAQEESYFRSCPKIVYGGRDLVGCPDPRSSGQATILSSRTFQKPKGTLFRIRLQKVLQLPISSIGVKGFHHTQNFSAAIVTYSGNIG